MLIPVIPTYRKRPPKRKVQFGPPPATALTLLAVTWDSEQGVLSLEFDRAISIASLNPDAFRLMDGITTQSVLAPYPPVLVQDQTTLTMGVIDVGPFTDPVVRLNVAADNGIVAVEGGTWAGCVDLAVPWP